MNIEICNAINGYIKTLYRMNQQCILLCGVDLFNNESDDYIIQTLDLIRDIPRVVPYQYSNREKRLYIEKKDGLIEYADEMPFLISNYERLLQENIGFLDNVRKVRNKYEHKMHDARWGSAGSGSNRYLCVTFEVTNHNDEKEDVNISITQCIHLLKGLNILFDHILTEVKEWAKNNNKTNHPYYRRLCQYKFQDFNTIYDSEITQIVGKVFRQI